MGGFTDYLISMRNVYGLQGKRVAPGVMAETGVSGETSEGHIKRFFGAGVTREREERKDRLLTVKCEGEAQEYRYDGTETGGAWVDG